MTTIADLSHAAEHFSPAIARLMCWSGGWTIAHPQERTYTVTLTNAAGAVVAKESARFLNEAISRAFAAAEPFLQARGRPRKPLRRWVRRFVAGVRQ